MCNSFLSILLIKTVIYWILIRAISKSSVLIFPIWKVCNDKRSGWPNTKEFILIKKWLQERGYNFVTVLTAPILGDIQAKQWIWDHVDKRIRIQVYVYPFSRNKGAVCYQLSSIGQDKRLIVTENIFLPFGGYIPPTWDIKHYPFVSKLESLHQLHALHIKNMSLAEWNAQTAYELVLENQKELKAVNTQKGFLFPSYLWPEQGQLTSEGSYRLWKSMIFLKYVGVIL